jgi:hypothetical protein
MVKFSPSMTETKVHRTNPLTIIEVRTLEPYRHLSKTTASPAHHTILLTTTSTPWSTLPHALGRLEFFIALIALCYILSEILVILVATIPFSPDEYWLAYLAGTYITFSILAFQILIFIAMMTWWRYTGPRLSRDPDTPLGVWTLLAASKIREDFEDLGTAGRQDLVHAVTTWHKKYWLGEVVGKDGVMNMGIHSDSDHDTRYEKFRGEQGGDVPPIIPQSQLSPVISPHLSPTIPQITVSPFI